MAKPQVWLMNQDLYAQGYVKSLPAIVKEKSFQRSKLITDSFNLQLDNRNKLFTIDHPDSMFQGTDWLYEPILIKNRKAITIWEGELIDVPSNDQTMEATLYTRDTLFKLRNTNVEYESSDYETLAYAFRNLCDAYDFTNYNNQSIERSNALYVQNDCKVKVNINPSDNITFQQVIEKFGEYGNANIYKDDELYFQHWEPFTGGASITITNKKMKTKSLVGNAESEIINDYSISYEGDLGIPATDSNSNNIGTICRNRYGTKSLPEMRSGDDGQILFEKKAGATYIGESYIKRTVKSYDKNPQPLIFQSFDIYADIEDYIDITTIFYHTYPDRNWTEKLFEIFSFGTYEDEDRISLLCYEVIT